MTGLFYTLHILEVVKMRKRSFPVGSPSVMSPLSFGDLTGNEPLRGFWAPLGIASFIDLNNKTLFEDDAECSPSTGLFPHEGGGNKQIMRQTVSWGTDLLSCSSECFFKLDRVRFWLPPCLNRHNKYNHYNNTSQVSRACRIQTPSCGLAAQSPQ